MRCEDDLYACFKFYCSDVMMHFLMTNHGNFEAGMKHAGRNLISVPFAHYDGADNETSHDNETAFYTPNIEGIL